MATKLPKCQSLTFSPIFGVEHQAMFWMFWNLLWQRRTNVGFTSKSRSPPPQCHRDPLSWPEKNLTHSLHHGSGFTALNFSFHVPVLCAKDTVKCSLQQLEVTQEVPILQWKHRQNNSPFYLVISRIEPGNNQVLQKRFSASGNTSVSIRQMPAYWSQRDLVQSQGKQLAFIQWNWTKAWGQKPAVLLVIRDITMLFTDIHQFSGNISGAPNRSDQCQSFSILIRLRKHMVSLNNSVIALLIFVPPQTLHPVNWAERAKLTGTRINLLTHHGEKKAQS